MTLREHVTPHRRKPSPSPLHLPLSQKANTQMQHQHHRPSSSVTQRYVTLRNCYAYALLTFLSTSLLSFLPITRTMTTDQPKPLNTARNDAINAENTAISWTQTLHSTQHAVNQTETHHHAVFIPCPLCSVGRLYNSRKCPFTFV